MEVARRIPRAAYLLPEHDPGDLFIIAKESGIGPSIVLEHDP